MVAAAPDGARTLDEVVVSATRRDVAASDFSEAVSVVAREYIERQDLVTDALASADGVFLQQTTPGQGAAIIRGLKGSSILHLVDGVRLNNAIFRSAPTQYLALVPVTAVERIESVRGTPASLYGSDAVGGIVNLVTRVPAFESARSRTSGSIDAAYDSADLARSLRATLDVGNRDVATSLSLEVLRTGDRRTGSGERIAPSGYEAFGGRYVMSVTPSDDRSWLFDVQFLEQPETPRIDELVPGFGQTEPSSSEFLFAPNRRLFAHARYEHDSAWLDFDWRVDLAWQRIDDDRMTRAFGADERLTERNRSDLAGFVFTASQTRSGVSWVGGIEAYHDRVSSERSELDLPSGVETPLTSRFPDGATVDTAAAFVNVDMPLTGRQTLTAGVRFSNVRVHLPETPVSVAAELDVKDFAGDIGWRFGLTDTWQLVANVGAGFRAPNVFDLGTLGNRPGNRFNIPNTALDSEHVIHADVGARARADSWRLELVLFALDYDDRITSISTGAITADGRDVVQSVNAAESAVYGAEFAATFAASDALDASLSMTWTRGEQTANGAAEPADRVPPLSGRISVDYAPDGPWRWSAWLDFAGEQDRLSARDVRDVRIDPDGTPGWLDIGARAEWDAGRGWRLSAGVDNLFDRRYRRHGSGLDAPGRRLTLGARFSW